MLGHRPIRQLFEVIVEVHLHSAVRKKWASMVAQSVKNLQCRRPGLGRSPEGGHGDLLQ